MPENCQSYAIPAFPRSDVRFCYDDVKIYPLSGAKTMLRYRRISSTGPRGCYDECHLWIWQDGRLMGIYGIP